MTLELIPNGDLIFKGPFTAVSTTTLTLSNSGNERFAYKIKTTAPKRYCVKPNSGYLEPHNTTNVQVMLQPQVTGQQDDRGKHKFMVQWAAVPNSYSEDVENFWKQDSTKYNVHDSKLKCVFADEQSAAVVPNDSYGQRDSDAPPTRATDLASAIETRSQQLTNKNEHTATTTSSLNQRFVTSTSRDSNPVQNQYQDRQQDAGDDSDISSLKKVRESVQNRYNSLKEEVKQKEARERNAGSDRIDNPVVNRAKTNQQQNGLVLFGITFNEQLVLVAFVVALLFGFSLGYFLFSCGN